MDIYSNILYVKEEFAALSALAHRCAAADKYRAETCCVVGNYYSLRCAWVGWCSLRCLRTYHSQHVLSTDNPSACLCLPERRGMHERAVQYFRRALRLNPHYLSAWTLMGHEYVELKNPPAAIGAVCCAVQCS